MTKRYVCVCLAHTTPIPNGRKSCSTCFLYAIKSVHRRWTSSKYSSNTSTAAAVVVVVIYFHIHMHRIQYCYLHTSLHRSLFSMGFSCSRTYNSTLIQTKSSAGERAQTRIHINIIEMFARWLLSECTHTIVKLQSNNEKNICSNCKVNGIAFTLSTFCRQYIDYKCEKVFLLLKPSFRKWKHFIIIYKS